MAEGATGLFFALHEEAKPSDLKLSEIFMDISGTPKWMVYKGKSIDKWMIWGYSCSRKPPFQVTYHMKYMKKVYVRAKGIFPQ